MLPKGGEGGYRGPFREIPGNFSGPKSNIGTLYLDCSYIQQRYQLKAWGDKKKL